MLERVYSASDSRLITYFAAVLKLLALLIHSYLSAIVVADASVVKTPGWFSQTEKKETANGCCLQLSELAVAVIGTRQVFVVLIILRLHNHNHSHSRSCRAVRLVADHEPSIAGCLLVSTLTITLRANLHGTWSSLLF